MGTPPVSARGNSGERGRRANCLAPPAPQPCHFDRYFQLLASVDRHNVPAAPQRRLPTPALAPQTRHPAPSPPAFCPADPDAEGDDLSLAATSQCSLPLDHRSAAAPSQQPGRARGSGAAAGAAAGREDTPFESPDPSPPPDSQASPAAAPTPFLTPMHASQGAAGAGAGAAAAAAGRSSSPSPAPEPAQSFGGFRPHAAAGQGPGRGGLPFAARWAPGALGELGPRGAGRGRPRRSRTGAAGPTGQECNVWHPGPRPPAEAPLSGRTPPGQTPPPPAKARLTPAGTSRRATGRAPWLRRRRAARGSARAAWRRLLRATRTRPRSTTACPRRYGRRRRRGTLQRRRLWRRRGAARSGGPRRRRRPLRRRRQAASPAARAAATAR
jgi:hypothetical protein